MRSAQAEIPVSTNPSRNRVCRRTKICTTPCSVRFDKQSNHLLTIVKDGYEQVDLEITRQFMPDEALRDGAIYGILKDGDPKDVAGEVPRKWMSRNALARHMSWCRPSLP